MESSVLNELSMVFLVAGGTLWLASWSLAARARAFRARMQAMLALSGQVQDPLDLPSQAWPALQASGWRSLHCAGTWFGQPWQRSLGPDGATQPRQRHASFTHHIDNHEDIALTLTLRAPRLRGEAQLLAQQMARVFAIMMESMVREKSEALAAALAQRAQLSLYLQHDMRNLCQWVGWVGSEFMQAGTQESLLQAALRLQRNAPLALERSQRLQAALQATPVAEPVQVQDLGEAWSQAAQLAGVELMVDGQAQVSMPRQSLARVLDNLLTNAAQAWREETAAPLRVSIEATAGEVSAALHCPAMRGGEKTAMGAHATADRLFEPFNSGRPGGLGLGLYQARKTLRDAGGDLQAQVLPQTLVFHLRLPGPGPAAT
ncbi:MAG: ATP-binding protein [Rhodoferax sp.]